MTQRPRSERRPRAPWICTAMTTEELGFKRSSDNYPHFVVIEHPIHQLSSNDEVERRGVAPTQNEGS